MALALPVILAAAGCGSDEETQATAAASTGNANPNPTGCVPGELELEDGSCLVAGTAAGVPPERCGEGFSDDGLQGCAPILPAEPCAPGTFAVPGDSECHPVAPCASGAWGDIPTDDETQHVDPSFMGGGSDGSAAAPHTSLEAAIAAASPGAIVALAQGSYVLDATLAIDGKALRLWGRCPELVHLESTALAAPTLLLEADADGSEVRSVSVSGAGTGIQIAASDVVLDRVWIHDTGEPGVQVLGPSSSATLTRSLIEAARGVGVFVAAGAVTLDAVAVRDTLPIGGQLGRGVQAFRFGSSPGRVDIRGSVIERSREAGVFMQGSELVLEASLVRDTTPSDNDLGLGVQLQGDDVGEVSTAEIIGSVIENSVETGINVTGGSQLSIDASVIRVTRSAQPGEGGYGLLVETPLGAPRSRAEITESVIDDSTAFGVVLKGSEAVIERSIVRGTRPRESDGRFGRGLITEPVPGEQAPPSATVRSSVFEANHDIGISISAGVGVIESTIVRDTRARAADENSGRGVGAEVHSGTLQRARLDVRGCVIEANREAGVFVVGSDVTIEDTLVRATQPSEATGRFGAGVHAQAELNSGNRPSVVVRRSEIADNIQYGVSMMGGDLLVEDTRVSRTAADAAGSYGDGIIVSALNALHASANVDRSHIDHNARAGVVTFSAAVTVRGTLLECNAIHLNGEDLTAAPFALEDLGDNTCGCNGTLSVCAVQSAALEPPEPLDSSDAF
jgi:hypothetical protein